MAPERRCGTCLWWCDRSSEYDPSTHPEECKRNAPILTTIWVKVSGEQTVHYPSPVWPLTYPGDFCGDWAARGEVPPPYLTPGATGAGRTHVTPDPAHGCKECGEPVIHTLTHKRGCSLQPPVDEFFREESPDATP